MPWVRSSIVAVLCVLLAQPATATTPGGSDITNAASLTYRDGSGNVYQTTSNVVTAQIATLSALVVTPKEAAANPVSDLAPVNASTVRTFTITNTSNITDAYQIGALTSGSLSVTSIAWSTPSGPIVTGVNGAVSPAVAPGASIAATLTIATSGLTVGQSVPVSLTAHTTVTGTANGIVQDRGTQWIVGGTAPHLSGPSGPNTSVLKTVNNSLVVQSQPGASVTFTIAAMNSGGTAATNVIVSDPVPSPLSVDLSSATIDGAPAGAEATLQGQTITFTMPTLAAGATVEVAFKATLPSTLSTGASFINVATISATGIPPVPTTPANVFDGSSNIVFDGFAGASHPVAGAIVTLLDAAGQPVRSNGLANPSVTGPDGSYSFALPASAISPGGSTFTITITAANYLNRRIGLTITPGDDGFYNVTSTSGDGEPLAMPGGFTLTRTNVALKDVFGLFGNLPLFNQNTIVVTKTVDKQAVAAGDRMIFTLGFQDEAGFPFTGVTIVDTMQSGLVYLTGTGKIDQTTVEPIVSGRTLTWTLPTLAAAESHQITYAATVVPDVAPGSTLVNSVAVTGTATLGNLPITATASTTITVIEGLLNMRRVVTGRVFFDDRHNGYFTKGDRPIAGVRVYLEDGSFVVTDSAGDFSFPSVRPGMHVLRVDPLTLPPAAKTRSDEPMNTNYSLQRLLHGVLDDGTMEDVEFAIVPK